MDALVNVYQKKSYIILHAFVACALFVLGYKLGDHVFHNYARTPASTNMSVIFIVTLSALGVCIYLAELGHISLLVRIVG